MASQWYYRKGKQKSGPVSSAKLKLLARSGQLSPADPVWKEGMSHWLPADKLKGLFPPAQMVVPPTLPPASTPPAFSGNRTPPPSRSSLPGASEGNRPNNRVVIVATVVPAVIVISACLGIVFARVFNSERKSADRMASVETIKLPSPPAIALPNRNSGQGDATKTSQSARNRNATEEKTDNGSSVDTQGTKSTGSKVTSISLSRLKSQFEARANAAITRGLSRPILSIRDSSDILQSFGNKTGQSQTPVNRINGIDEGVGRFFMMWPAVGSFLVIQAAAEQFPGQSDKLDIVSFLAGKPIVDAASKSLDRDDAADFYGKAAIQYTNWKIAGQPSAQHRQEIGKMNLTAGQKRQLLEDFIDLQQDFARRSKSNYEQIMQMGAREGLPLPK